MRGATAALAPLRHRDFRLVWSGQTASLGGDSFHSVAVVWLVLRQLGRSPLALGGVLAGRAVASAVLLLVGGAVVDRFTPRALMVVSALVRLALATALAGLVTAGVATLWQVVVLEVAFGCADAFALPAEASVAPTLLPTHHLDAAGALAALSDNASRLAGPVAAGLVVAGFGLAPAFAVDAASFALAAALFGAVRTVPGPPADQRATRPGMLGEIGEGVGHVLSVPALRAVLVVYAAGCLGLGGPYLVGIPALATGRFEGGAITVGLLFGVWGAGQFAGNLYAGMAGRPVRTARLLGFVTLACGAAWGFVGIAPGAAAAALLIGVAGAADGVGEVVAQVWAQRAAGARLLGRVMSTLELVRSLLLPVALVGSGLLAGPAVGVLFAVGGGLYALAALGPLLTPAESQA